jgi:hypothetical protein
MRTLTLLIIMIISLHALEYERLYDEEGITIDAIINNDNLIEITTKTEFILNASHHQIESLFKDYANYPKWKMNVIECDLIKNEGDEKTVIQEFRNRPWPLSDTLEQKSIDFTTDPNGELHVVFVLLNPLKDEHRRGEWHFRPITKNSYHVTRFYTGAGHAPITIPKSLLASRIPDLIVKEAKQLQSQF